MSRRRFFNGNRPYNNCPDDSSNGDCCCDNDCNNNSSDSCCDINQECANCTVCPPGPRGPMGPQGPVGPAGGVLNFADFYALMPPDNAATVAPGTDVSFPRNGSSSGLDIIRTGPSSFNLTQIGTYLIMFQVSVTEAEQLMLTLNGEELADTVVGRATGTSQIVGTSIVTTTVINSILTVRNPAGNATALGITPLAGGTRANSAHLVILQIQ